MREIKFRAWDKNYEVGSDGSVWSLNYNNTRTRKRIKTYPDKNGYPYVFLMFGKRQKKMVHRLVAELFLKKPSPKHQVNHKNGKRDDNRLENLEWVTSQENTLHGWRFNKRKQSKKQIETAVKLFSGSKNPKSKLNKAKVLKIRRLRKDGFMLKEIANKFNISTSQVGAICQGRFWK